MDSNTEQRVEHGLALGAGWAPGLHNIKKLGLYATLILFCAANVGCVHLSRGEKEDLRMITDAGFSSQEERVKSVPLAGALNILPGFGNFYLAIGTEETEQWLVGFMNLLFWPISVVWGIPEAAIDASILNKRETVYYFMRTERGRAELQEALDLQRALPPLRP